MVKKTIELKENTKKEYHKKWNEEMAKLLEGKTGMLREEFASYRNCPLCGDSQDRLVFIKTGFRFIQCKKCHFVYVNPVINEKIRGNTHISEAYNFHYQQKEKPSLEKEQGCERVLKEILRLRGKRGRLLDIGCGQGFFLDIARQFGFETYGNEINETAAKRAEDISGSKIIKGKFEDAFFLDEYYDVITLFQTLEHLDNPLFTLQKAYKILKLGGVIVVDVPNIDSFIIKVLKQHHRHFTGKGHINYFTPVTLKEMMKRAGFKKILKVETREEECSPSTVLQLLINPTLFDFFSPRYYQRATTRGVITGYLRNSRISPIIRKIYRSITTTIDRPFSLITNVLKKGAYVKMYAQK